MEKDIELYGQFCIALNKLEKSKEFAYIIPEVRSNMVFARENAKLVNDVLAVDGRITIVDNMPKAAGKPKFGASSHMARLIIEIMKKDYSMRAGIDFANDDNFAKWLNDYCDKKGWPFGVIDRSNEPEEMVKEDKASMPWKVMQAINSAGSKVPKIFYEKGAVGKEPVSVIVGKNPIEIVEQIIEIAKEYGDNIKWKR